MLKVHILLGLIYKYGITIHERQLNPMSKTGPKTDEDAVQTAVDMIIAAGGRVSERAVRQALIGLQRKASDRAIRDRLREMREAGAIPAAVRVRANSEQEALGPAPVESLPCTVEVVDAAPAVAHNQGAPLRERQKQGQEEWDQVDPCCTAPSAAVNLSLPLPLSLTAANSHKNTKGVWEPAAVPPVVVAEADLSLPLPLPLTAPAQCDPAFNGWLEDMMLQVATEIEADLLAAESTPAPGGGAVGAHDPASVLPQARITEHEHDGAN